MNKSIFTSRITETIQSIEDLESKWDSDSGEARLLAGKTPDNENQSNQYNLALERMQRVIKVLVSARKDLEELRKGLGNDSEYL